jgi:hypothetical protein
MALVRKEFRNFVDYCLAGRPFPKKIRASDEAVLVPGDVVCASDCDYTVSPCGAWLKTSDMPSDTKRSRIYVPTKASRKDKYGNLRLTS